MKRTYTGTLFHPDLTEAEVRLYVSKKNKYERGSRIYMADDVPEDEELLEFTGLRRWDVIEGGKEAEVLEEIVDEIDENHEYLVLYFENKVEIYCNSKVTMFIW